MLRTHVLVVAAVALASMAIESNGDAAVYAHGDIVPTKAVPDLVTQTVYGFLDFTTTIGNTVMVFSPQSAPPPEASKAAAVASPPPTTTPEPVAQVIDSKPREVSTSKPEIEPSKPVSARPSEKQLTNVVRVVAATSPQQQHPPQPHDDPAGAKVQIVSSHVELVDDGKKSHPKPIAHVDAVREQSAIISSHVEIVSPSIVESVPIESKNLSPRVVSSVVEIHASEDLDQLIPVENNINDPDFEFLSREPSELTEETYRLPLNKSPSSKYHQKPRAGQDGAGRKSHANTQRGGATAAASGDGHPTGLVTKLGGTIVKDGLTTVHETSVIGTYISGKYAQVLQSTSHLIANAAKAKIAPTNSLRVLKTAAPHLPKKPHVVEPVTRAATQESDEVDEIYGSSQSKNLVRSQRRPAVSSNTFKNRFRSNSNRSSPKDEPEYADVPTSTAEHTTPSPNYKKSRATNKSPKNNRYNRLQSSTVEVATVSAVFSEPSSTSAYSNRRNKSNRNGFKSPHSQARESSNQHSHAGSSGESGHQRRFKPKITPSAAEHETHSSSVYKFKLNRQPGRWQYKTSPKPRVTIRKQNNDDEAVLAVTPSLESAALLEQHADQGAIVSQQSPVAATEARTNDEGDLDSSGSVNGDVLNDADTLDNGIEHKKLPVETLKVEISTPADFKDTYYEIATIKSPYTYHVGSVKNTRFITVTSTFEKTLDPEPTSTTSLVGPLTENILATTSAYDRDNNLLDSSIATLPPILLSSGVETPPLETLTETFSTTQTMLKTHILPVLHEGGNTTSYTLTQTYMITRLVTATKTLPPMDAYHFNPSKALKEFNSKLDEAGSELNLELDFGDDNEDDDEASGIRHALPDDLDLANIGSSFDISDVDKSNIPEAHLRPKKKVSNKATDVPQQLVQSPTPPTDPQAMQNLSPEQLQQLALLRLLNPGAQVPQVITTSKPIIRLETVFESHVIPVYNGVSTSFSTISRPVATVSKTEYEIGTSTLPQLPLPQPPPINPLFQQPQQFQITTAPIITQTVVTETRSKILKLTFGAKTAYTTLFSTKVVPTILTTYITQSVPIVQQTAAFAGYFPAPYAPYPYVG